MTKNNNNDSSAYEAAEDAITRRMEALNQLAYYWCEVTGRDDVNRRTIQIIFAHLQSFGADRVLPWIDRAYTTTNGSDIEMGKYVSGIVRNVREEEADDE